MCPKARVDGKRIGVWENIDLKRSNCDTEMKNSTTKSSPEKNFLKNGKKLEQSERPDERGNWLEGGRVE